MDKKQLIEIYQKYRLILFPGITAISSVVLIVLVIFPQLSKFMSNNTAYNDIVKKNDFLEVKAIDLEVVNEVDLKQKLDTSLVALPANKDITEIIGIIQSIIAQSGFVLSSLQFGEDISIGGQSAFKVKLDIAGSATVLNVLLSNIESSYRPMKIDTIDISNPKNSDNINGTLTINVFYAPIPNTLGSIDAPVPKLSEKEEEIISTLARSTTVATENTNISIGNFAPRGKINPFE